MSTSAEISPAPAAGPRRAALGFIFVTIALDALAMGIVVPVLPRLVEGFVGGDTARAAARSTPSWASTGPPPRG